MHKLLVHDPKGPERLMMHTRREQGDQAMYVIRVKGVLDETWSDWLGGLTVTPLPQGETLLSGPIRDQAALHGLLVKIRDMGLTLLSVNCEDTDDTTQDSAR
jgi:hypothetical protein